MSRARAFSVAAFVALVSTIGGDAVARADSATPASPGLDRLLELCAKSPGLSAEFTEERKSALLVVPLRSEGAIHFAPGRGLVRHTSKPSPQTVLVTDKDLVFWDGKTTKRITLGTSATIETFARAFSLLLTANRAELAKSFALDFHPDDAGDGFRLRLTPRGADLQKVIASMEIEGRGLALTVLRVRETNGDVSTTRFSSVDAAKRYTDAELDRLFRVPSG